MNSISLRQLIKESIQEYIREVETSGNVAAQEAKMKACDEAIALREKKLNMEGLDEAYHDMIDEAKKKNLEKEIKELKKYKAKTEKLLEKMKAKAEGVTAKKVEDEGMENEGKMEDEGMVDEIDLDEYAKDPESGPQLEEIDEARFKKGTDIGKKGKGFAKIAKSAAKRYGSEEAGKRVAGAILKKVLKKEEKELMNESFLYMQKLAGVITEAEYKQKKSLITENIYESLNPKEKEIFDDIVNTLNEGEGWLEKLKSYAKKGVLTLSIVAALLGGASALNSTQKQEVVNTVKTELVSKEKTDISYITDAFRAHDAYMNHKDKVDQLAKTDSKIYSLINDLTYKDWKKMSADEQVMIGKHNQDAIKQIMQIK